MADNWIWRLPTHSLLQYWIYTMSHKKTTSESYFQKENERTHTISDAIEENKNTKNERNCCQINSNGIAMEERSLRKSCHTYRNKWSIEKFTAFLLLLLLMLPSFCASGIVSLFVFMCRKCSSLLGPVADLSCMKANNPFGFHCT